VIILAVADGKLGYVDGAPYDAIHVGAAAAGLNYLHIMYTPHMQSNIKV
jgi:hypothetical protein